MSEANSNIPVLHDVVSLGTLVPSGTEPPSVEPGTQQYYADPKEATQTVFVRESNASSSGSGEFALGAATTGSEEPTVFNLDDAPADKARSSDPVNALVDETMAKILPDVEKLARKTLLDLLRTSPLAKDINNEN